MAGEVSRLHGPADGRRGSPSWQIVFGLRTGWGVQMPFLLGRAPVLHQLLQDPAHASSLPQNQSMDRLFLPRNLLDEARRGGFSRSPGSTMPQLPQLPES